MKQKLQFAERLRYLRDRKGMTNAQLGEAVGLSHVSIGNFLEGRLPRSEYLVALAQYFDVTTDWLVGNDAHPGAIAMSESTPEYLIDDAFAELEDLKEKVQSLERALRRIRVARNRAASPRRKSDRDPARSRS